MKYYFKIWKVKFIFLKKKFLISLGNIYEGTQTNFFIIYENIVITAPNYLVLEGTIRKIVLSVCEKNNIPLSLTLPNISKIEEWEGAFITSNFLFTNKI